MNMRPRDKFDPSKLAIHEVDEAGARIIERGIKPAKVKTHTQGDGTEARPDPFDPANLVIREVDEAGANLIEQGIRPFPPSRRVTKSNVPPFGVPPLELAKAYGGQLSIIIHLSYYQERYRRPVVASGEHCGGADGKTIDRAVRRAVELGWATAERPSRYSAWIVTLKFGPWYRSQPQVG